MVLYSFALMKNKRLELFFFFCRKLQATALAVPPIHSGLFSFFPLSFSLPTLVKTAVGCVSVCAHTSSESVCVFTLESRIRSAALERLPSL